MWHFEPSQEQCASKCHHRAALQSHKRKGRAHKPSPKCKHTPWVVANPQPNLPSVSQAWRAAPALPKQLLTLLTPLPVQPTALRNSMCQHSALQLSRISLGVRVRALSSSRSWLNSREDLKLKISRNFLDVLASACCQNFLLSFPNLLLYWKFKWSLEGSRNRLVFSPFLGEK